MSRTRVAAAAQILLIMAGVLVTVFPFTLGAHAELTCRSVVMRPGDGCPKADGSAVQTYEQRLAARTSARPVIAGLGLLVTAFGTALLIGGQRSKTHSPRGSRAHAMRRSASSPTSGRASAANQPTAVDSSSPTTATPDT